MSNRDEYLGKVIAAIWFASDHVSKAGIAEAQRLVDHGEPAEGMCSLAWAIVNEGARVPAGLIRDIRSLSEELVPAEELRCRRDGDQLGSIALRAIDFQR